jgi:UDP-N-acetyl-D-glucosamine dehydrogenase
LGARELPLFELSAEKPASADAVVVVTNHDTFDFEFIESHARSVFDTWNRLRDPTIERL